MNSPESQKPGRKQYWLNLTLAGVAAQVGCVTLLIVFGAVFGGLWMDAQFQSKPVFTIILLLVSVPVSVGLMFLIARGAVSRIKSQSARISGEHKEEVNLNGEHS
jgi:F0F1-type ATP synthase assembly protein I